MENGHVDVEYSNTRLPHENNPDMMNCRNQYAVPANYNPADHPPVKLRNHNSNADQSETQRKRRSKNRLSNRRSTGFVSSETVEEAFKMGSEGQEQENEHNK